MLYHGVSKEIGSEQIPNSTIAALGKMPGSEGAMVSVRCDKVCIFSKQQQHTQVLVLSTLEEPAVAAHVYTVK